MAGCCPLMRGRLQVRCGMVTLLGARALQFSHKVKWESSGVLHALNPNFATHQSCDLCFFSVRPFPHPHMELKDNVYGRCFAPCLILASSSFWWVLRCEALAVHAVGDVSKKFKVALKEWSVLKVAGLRCVV